MKINMNNLNALESAYYAALYDDPCELEESTRELGRKVKAIYEVLEPDF